MHMGNDVEHMNLSEKEKTHSANEEATTATVHVCLFEQWKKTWLFSVYRGLYCLVIWGLFHKPLYIRIPSLNNQDFMESKVWFFSRLKLAFLISQNLALNMLRLAGGMNHHQVTRAVPSEFLTYSTFQEAISTGTYLLQTPVCAGAIVVCLIDICLETVVVKKVNNSQMVVKNADLSHGFESVNPRVFSGGGNYTPERHPMSPKKGRKFQ